MCKRPVEMYVAPTVEGEAPWRFRRPCRNCWQCNAQYINDYVGRCLAENVHSDHSAFVTLTYAPDKHRSPSQGGDGGRDDLAEVKINGRHFQKFIRAIRRRGYRVRYLATAEFGERKGRVHFHACLFFEGDAPPINDPDDKGRVWNKIWPHGHMNWEWGLDARRIKYVCKYILKGRKRDLSQGWKTQSLKPALGARWFAEKAADMARLRVYPTSFTYQPPGGDPKVKYYMTGATRRDYLLAIREHMGDGAHDNVENLTEWVLEGYRKLDRQIDRDLAAGVTKQQLDEEILTKLAPKRPCARQILRNSIDFDEESQEVINEQLRKRLWSVGYGKKAQKEKRQDAVEQKQRDARREFQRRHAPATARPYSGTKDSARPDYERQPSTAD